MMPNSELLYKLQSRNYIGNVGETLLAALANLCASPCGHKFKKSVSPDSACAPSYIKFSRKQHTDA